MQKPQSSVSSLRHRRAEMMHGVIFDFASSAVHVAVVGTLPQTTDVQDLPRAEFVPYYPIKQLSHELKTGLGRLVNWPQDQDQLQQAQIKSGIWSPRSALLTIQSYQCKEESPPELAKAKMTVGLFSVHVPYMRSTPEHCDVLHHIMNGRKFVLL